MRRRRFQKEDWLHLGLSELSENGAEAVKLEAICKAAGLTRGSFYHHFDDHTAFLVAMAEAWIDLQTDAIIEDFEKENPSDEALRKLNAAVMNIDFHLELGMREIARRISAVAEIVQRADASRLAVLQKIYQRRFDLTDADARAFAQLEYAAFNGFVLVAPDMPVGELDKMARRYDEMARFFLTQRG